MKTKIGRMLLALASVVIASASITSALTFAVGQKSSARNPLTGTSWQLVKFQGPDERIFTPEDKSKYTIKFGGDRPGSSAGRLQSCEQHLESD